jgi:hypothetical protein
MDGKDKTQAKEVDEVIQRRRVDELSEWDIKKWDECVDRIVYNAHPIGGFVPINVVGKVTHISPIAFLKALGLENYEFEDTDTKIMYYWDSIEKEDKQEGWTKVIKFVAIDHVQMMHELVMSSEMFEYLDKAEEIIRDREREARRLKQEAERKKQLEYAARRKAEKEERLKREAIESDGGVPVGRTKDTAETSGLRRFFGRGG